jgi:hypothetical protein
MDIQDGACCILGQLFPDSWEGFERLGGESWHDMKQYGLFLCSLSLPEGASLRGEHVKLNATWLKWADANNLI